MLLNENLLRNMIRHVLTRKLLKENASEEAQKQIKLQLERAQTQAEKFKSEFINKFENENTSINKKPKVLEQILCKIIYEVLIISCFFNKNKVVLGENITDRGDSKLIEIVNSFINRKGETINWDGYEILGNDTQFASSTNEMKKLFLALGLQYHTFFEWDQESSHNDNRTGGQIARIYKNKAIKQVLAILQSQKILSNYIDGLMNNANTKPQEDLNFSEEPKDLEGNQQQKTNSKNEDDLDFEDYNDIGMKSKLPNSKDFLNSKKSQWPKSFLKRGRIKSSEDEEPKARTPVENIIRHMEDEAKSDNTFAMIIKRLLENNKRFAELKQPLYMHIYSYVRLFSDYSVKYRKYYGAVKDRLKELIQQELDKYQFDKNKQPQQYMHKESISKEINNAFTTLFSKYEENYQNLLKQASNFDDNQDNVD